MNNTQIVISWLSTIVIGSIILSFVVATYDNNLEMDSFLGILVLGSMFAAAFSIPAVISFVIYNNRYSKNILDKKIYKKKMMLLHLIVGAIYFFCALLFVFIIGFDEESIYILLTLLFSYLPAGLVVWYLFLNKTDTNVSDDIIDV